jgi:hypothetical protein
MLHPVRQKIGTKKIGLDRWSKLWLAGPRIFPAFQALHASF